LPPRRPLFPYTPLFRSHRGLDGVWMDGRTVTSMLEPSFLSLPIYRLSRNSLGLMKPRSRRFLAVGAPENSTPNCFSMEKDFDPRSEEHTSELQSQSNLV